MKILIAGGTGFIGRSIIKHLKLDAPIEYHILTRKHLENKENIHYHYWDGKTIGPWKAFIDHCDIVINLAGKSVNCRYNKKNKDEIYNSRIDSTFILGEAISHSKQPPKLWLNASTATIYKDERKNANDEYNGVLGNGFSVDVAKKWEETFYAAYTPFTRKIALRSAIVFGQEAEVFKIYKNHIHLGLSGRHGDGNQMVSWIHEIDFTNAIKHFIANESSVHNYNLSAPGAVSDKTFLGTFRKVMNKNYSVPIPKWMLTIGAYFLNTETELLLKSRWVYPARLLEEGFMFTFPNHTEALKHLVRNKVKNLSENKIKLDAVA